MTPLHAPPPAQPLIGFGQVRHTRLKPVHHAFSYGSYFLMLPMRSLQHKAPGHLAYNRSGWLSFFDIDHGDGRSPAQGGALGWLDEMLHSQGIHDATGEAWLHCYPRVLGYTFKPVSFWYCYSPATESGQTAALRAVVVEVNNTFGERHCYLLDKPRWGAELLATKVFHVSPFCAVDGIYRFRFMRTQHRGREKTVARIDYDNAAGPLLQTSVSGDLHILTKQTVRRALWQYPAMTWGLIARIHWQALQLWLKKVTFHHKPDAPARFVTRQAD